MEKIIVLNHVSKSFKKKTLFQDICLEINAASINGFVGINGCGKSVLFKLISGLYQPDKGEIYVYGKKNGIETDFPEDMGIMIDSPGFIEIYSGFTNLKYLAEIKNKIDDEKIKYTMKLLGLNPNNKTRVKNYSLGMKQKLGIIQAIMEDQKIIILDEPFNALDKESCKNLKELIKTLKKKGKTILLTSHNQNDLDELCDNIYLLEDKQLQQY